MKEKSTFQASPELVQFMHYHKIPTVDQLIGIDNEVLLKMLGFGWRLMKEVLELRKV
jgi:hypothetical protein